MKKPTTGLVVDGSTRGNPGPSKYKCVDLRTGKIVFQTDWIGITTNNVTEFLAICHAIYYLEKRGEKMPIYSDSVTAISWVNKKNCNTQCKNMQERIDKAIKYIKGKNVIIEKWHTSVWGENPADYQNKMR